MNITDKKNRLKNEIDKVNDPEILNRISALLANSEGTLMTDEQLAIVMERRADYLKDSSQAISLEDFKATIKKKYGF